MATITTGSLFTYSFFKFPNRRPLNNNILPSEPRALKYVLNQYQRISYPSLVCTRVCTTWMSLAMVCHAQLLLSICYNIFILPIRRTMVVLEDLRCMCMLCYVLSLKISPTIRNLGG